MAKSNKFYGWQHDLPDNRDHLYSVPEKIVLPKSVDLRPNCPPVVDQGQLGSCTANSIANAHRFDQIKEGIKNNFLPSRLFIYYNERDMEGTVKSDSGAQIRDGIKSIGKLGVCPEQTWPYVISKFELKPPAEAYKEGLSHVAMSYQRLDQTLDMLRGCLASGYPFVYGFTVYDSFESDQVAKTGIVPMPSKSESVKGGHAVFCVGYDDTKQWFITMNSWGTAWGDKGFFYIPYNYLTNTHLASDFWTVRTVES